MFVCFDACGVNPETPAWSMRPVGDGQAMASVRCRRPRDGVPRVDAHRCAVHGVVLHRMKLRPHALVVARAGMPSGPRRTAIKPGVRWTAKEDALSRRVPQLDHEHCVRVTDTRPQSAHFYRNRVMLWRIACLACACVQVPQ